MARKTLTRRCTEPACRETSFVEYTSQRELAGIAREWKCSRHLAPEEVLSPANRERTAVLVCTPLYSKPDRWQSEPKLIGSFWRREGESSGSGYVSGPGYKAHAADFPLGTRLVVSVRVELPEEAS